MGIAVAVVLPLIVAIVLLKGSSTVVTQENYWRISKDMRQDDVYSILGRPTETDLRPGGRMSREVWRDGEKEIRISFQLTEREGKADWYVFLKGESGLQGY